MDAVVLQGLGHLGASQGAVPGGRVEVIEVLPEGGVGGGVGGVGMAVGVAMGVGVGVEVRLAVRIENESASAGLRDHKHAACKRDPR